jgi:hypothetical protein
MLEGGSFQNKTQANFKLRLLLRGGNGLATQSNLLNQEVRSSPLGTPPLKYTPHSSSRRPHFGNRVERPFLPCSDPEGGALR